METKPKTQSDKESTEELNARKDEVVRPIGEEVMESIHLSEDKLGKTLNLSGVTIGGVQYYDLSNILHINNTRLANFIDLLKAKLKSGLKLHFVNVNDRIKEKMKSMGVDKLFNCG